MHRTCLRSACGVTVRVEGVGIDKGQVLQPRLRIRVGGCDWSYFGS
jgi:hypothetical protein